MKKRFLLVPLLVCLFSCSDKYQSFISHYQFKSPDGKPDYSNLDYWAAHPWKQDPSDSVPAPLINETRDSVADVFFLHPTTYTLKRKLKKQNADIDDDYINAKTDYSTILFQASVFNQQCRVFAPRYRQAHISNFFLKDKEKKDQAFDLAYDDLKKAFIYYLKNWNKGRPIIIAAHSQGSLLAERLLKEFFEDKPLQNKLVVAYIIGWPVPKEYFTSLEICRDSLQTGCFCSWRTLRRGFVPYYLKKENGNSYVTNPLSWTTTNEYVSKKWNKGSVLTKFNKVYYQTTDAQISNGLLYVKKPKFPWSFIYFTRNYHIADINLYYLNIRENLRQRIRSYQKRNNLVFSDTE
ncbi:MAG TPA: DUF3089 domain-containing protein [Chitinophagaceae bacterium]